ncbi:hypothetical protein CR513_22421, partial [Mucuna pruriens]
MSEQAILDLTCQMTMAATTHRTKGCSDKSAALAIIQGFIGQLKDWWDNLCTENDRLTILNSVKNETNQEDAVSTLIYTIIQNFIGDPDVFKNRAANQLTNLYYPTMSDYRWYKDTFPSKVTLREDGFANFWKEKFIEELPKLFSEKKVPRAKVMNFLSSIWGRANEAPSARHKKKQKQERSYNKSYKQYRRSTYKRKRVSNKNQNPIVENKQRFNKKQRHKNIKREVKCWKCGKEEEDGYCLGTGICNCNDCKAISTLTKDQTFVLINIIDKLEESSLKDEFITERFNYKR